MTLALNQELTGPDAAPPLVLSNSIGTTLAMWDGQAAALAGSHRVLRHDMRGHGSSPRPPGPYLIEDLGRDLIELLDANGLEPIADAVLECWFTPGFRQDHRDVAHVTRPVRRDAAGRRQDDRRGHCRARASRWCRTPPISRTSNSPSWSPD